MIKDIVHYPLKKKLKRLYRKLPFSIFDIVVYVLLIFLAFVFVYPFLFMIVNSFKSYNDIINVTVKWLPKEFTLSSYKIAINALNVKETFFNSVFVTIVSTIGHVLSCSFIGYGFARFKFPLRNVLFGIVILSILVPVQTLIIPMYITYSNLNMIGTYLPLIFPTFLGFGLKGGLFVFLFRQYFIRIPKSLDEAASIDGCGPLRVFFQIALPSSGATTIVCIVLSLVWHWNDFYEPGIYISSFDKMMLPQILGSLYHLLGSMAADPNVESAIVDTQIMYHKGVVMAGTVIAIIPPFIAYLFLQRRFMEGVERTGLVE